MTLYQCVDCHEQVSPRAGVCPTCHGFLVPAHTHTRMMGYVGYALLTLALVIGIPGLILTVGLDSLSSVSTVQASSTYEVSYLVYGIMGTTGTANVTYRNAQGGIQQETVTVPWKYAMWVPRGTVLSLSAQGPGGWNIVFTEIWVGDQVFKQSKSSGSYSIATASGVCCP